MKIEIINNVNQLSTSDNNAILQLAIKNAEFLDVHIFKKGTPVYDLMAKREYIRTNTYLSWIGINGQQCTHLIIAKDNNKLIGYILFTKAINNPKLISIISTVVDNNHRNHGVFRAMLDVLKPLTENIALSCSIEHVPMYQKLGFHVNKQWETQIAMNTANVAPNAQIMTVDDEMLNKHPDFTLAINKLKSKGININSIINKMNQDTQKEVQRASKYIEQLASI